MHFLLLVLRMMLDRLLPAWRDGLQLAARADGRLEHVPQQGGRWGRMIRRGNGYLPSAATHRASGARGQQPRTGGNATSEPGETSP